MSRILTALQPSGILHIGNYFGAIEPAVKLQAGNHLYLFSVDYHAITVPQDPKQLGQNILFAAATYLAAGIDPTKTTIFQQSRVPQHTELGWILTCLTRMGEAERMTQYKDKVKVRGENATVGLFAYPMLMAADILLYDTEIVPIGEDQKQHVELARDLAERFNKTFGETFVIPKPVIRENGARIMGLDDPTKKMSKSAASEKNYISLMDEEKVIEKKIKSAVTDSENKIIYDEHRPGVANLMTIFSLITGKTMEQITIDYATARGYGDFKADVAEALILFLKPLRAGIQSNLKQKENLIEILEMGAEKAREQAEKKMKLVRERIGVTLA